MMRYEINVCRLFEGNMDEVSCNLPNSYPTGSTPTSIGSGDFNNDDYLDLIVVNSGNSSLTIYMNNRQGTFRSDSIPLIDTSPRFVTVGDFDRDGKLDVAVANLDSFISVLLGHGDGAFQEKTIYPTDDQSAAIVTDDVNHDMILDLLMVSGYGRSLWVLIGNGDGTFQTAVKYPTGNNPQSIITGDFNHDERLDLAVANLADDTVGVLFGNGDGTFQK